MIRAFAFFLLLAAVVVFVALLVEHPGTVRIAFADYRLHASVGFLGVAVLLLVLAAVFADRLWRYLIAAPHRIAGTFRENRRRRGYRALTQGLVAVAAGDVEKADALARRAKGLLHDQPLAMLLSAQVAQLRGDEGAATDYFEAMLHHPEMAFFGIRGLFTQALREGDGEKATRLARRAYALQPKAPWVVQALFERELHAGKLEDADTILRQAIRQGVLPAAEGNRRRAVLLIRQSILLEGQGQTREAWQLVQDAWKLASDFGPAAIFYARLANGQGATRRAEKAIEKAWSKNPHPDLAKAYLEIDRPEEALQRLRKIEKLAGLRPDHPESDLAIGEAALTAEIWGEAKSHLEKAMAARPSARAFRAMAELESAAGDAGNGAAAARWLARAAEAPSDPRWVCGNCNAIAESWAPVCAHCGAFDCFAWRLPGSEGFVGGAASPSHIFQEKSLAFQG